MSGLEWCDRSDWNAIRGCTRVSPGCGGPGNHGGCYAEAIAARFSDPGAPFHGFAERTSNGPRWTGKVGLIEERLTLPLGWRKPARVFVNSMFDLFHESIPDEWIDRIFAVMALAPQHTFQVLTKRAKRMREYVSAVEQSKFMNLVCSIYDAERLKKHSLRVEWPLANVWLGVSAEDQTRADERIPDLLATPAAVRFVSAEPLLGPIDFVRVAPKGGEFINALRGNVWAAASSTRWIKLQETARLDLIITGGESGPGARPNWTPNVRNIVKQCAAAGVACFVKQLGANVEDRDDAGFDGCDSDSWPEIDPARIERDLSGYLDNYQGAPVRIHLRDRKGGDMAEWPKDLQVRQLPGREHNDIPGRISA